jgi:pSer/pThr/pTyr-binding forkhead associated (FHA) protein
MRCRQCGHQNEPGARFCSSCGSALPNEEDATLSIAELAERLDLDEELGAVIAELPAGSAMLVVRRGPNAGSRYVLDGDVTRLGRHPDSDIFLDDITVSRRHAAIRRTPAGFEVSDIGSLNGTYVDHKRVDTAPLHHLADLQIGRFVLVFIEGGHETVQRGDR